MAQSRSIACDGRGVIWRVTAPAAGNDEGDITLVETPSESAARNSYERLRFSSWPVRLERVRCAPRQWR